MSGGGTIDRLIAVGRPDLAERLKHLAGKHNQQRHGWRFAKGGDDAARLGAARRSMRGRDAGERAEYRKRAGMPQVKPLERKQPQPRAAKYPEVPKLKTAGEYADWVTANGYTKAANFDKIHPDDAHEIARSLVENGADFPDARDSLTFVGTAEGYRELLRNDAEAAWEKASPLYDVYRADRRKKIKDGYMRRYYKANGANMLPGAWAQAVNRRVEKKAVILISTHMMARNRDKLMADLARDISSGFHPVGADTFKSIIDHEYGHVIDYAYARRSGASGARMTAAKNVHNAINSWAARPGGLRQALCAYGASKSAEAWAEAWAEFRNNPNPRPAATEIGKLILELGKM